MNLDIRASRRGAVVCAAAMAALAGQAAGQVDRSWADAVSGSFTDGARWTPSGTPQPEDTVTIAAEGAAYTVTLDATSTVSAFALTWSDATFDLGAESLGVTGQLSLMNGSFGGTDMNQGATVVGSMAGAGATMRDFDLFGSQGDVTLADMTVVNLNSFDVGPNGTLTLEGNNIFQNVMGLEATGDALMRGGGSTLICDTCVDFGGVGRNVAMEGNGTSMTLEGESEATNKAGTTFTVSSGGSNFITGDPKSGSQSFTNEGAIVQASVTGRSGRGVAGTFVEGLDFFNKGTVEARVGTITFADDTGVVNDQVLVGGAWIVQDLGSLSTGGSMIATLGNGARVSLVGASSQFVELQTLTKINEGSRLGISQGRDFEQQQQAFSNFGELSIGQGSTFTINEFGLTNLSNSVLTDGVYEVAGTLMLPSNDQVQFLEASVRLIGPDSVFAAMDALETVGAQGFFGVEQGRAFTTVDDFQVIDGGRVFVGQGSLLDVNGQLVNFSNGVFEDARFEVAGTLRAPGIAITDISNELILDGAGSQFVDEFGNDALASLNRIAPDGILRLRNGRTLNNLEQLIVEGVLEIDPGSGGGGGSGGPALGQLSTQGDIVFAPGSELIAILQGSQVGQGPLILAGGDVLLGGGSGVGGTLSLVLGGSYTPEVGDEFLLIKGGSVQGDFEGFRGLDLGSGLSLEVLMGADYVAVRVVPAPGALGVLALGGIMATRRRRR